MTMKDAIKILSAYYGVETKGAIVSAINSIQPDRTTDEVWDAWTRLLKHAK